MGIYIACVRVCLSACVHVRTRMWVLGAHASVGVSSCLRVVSEASFVHIRGNFGGSGRPTKMCAEFILEYDWHIYHTFILIICYTASSAIGPHCPASTRACLPDVALVSCFLSSLPMVPVHSVTPDSHLPTSKGMSNYPFTTKIDSLFIIYHS